MFDGELAFTALRYLGESHVRPSVVVIGAMDGVSFDDFAAYIREYRWTGLFVEPNPTQFRRLQRYYAQLGYGAQNKYENSAIADHDGTLQLMIIDPDAVDAAVIHPCFGGMSAIYPPRNGLGSEADAATVRKFGRLIDVTCLTLRTLLERHGIAAIDVLSIDAEGWDYDILRQLDFAIYRPRVIRCETSNLAADQRDAVRTLLTGHGYFVQMSTGDLDAVPQEFLPELRSFQRRSNGPLTRPGRVDAVTLVTGVFASAPDGRASATLTPEVERLIDVDWPLVVFAEPEMVRTFQQLRRHAPSFFSVQTDADAERFAFHRQVLAWRSRPPTADADPASARAAFRRDTLTLSKQFFLNDASIFNPFGTPYFLWIEPTLALDETWNQLFTAAGQRNVAAQLADERMHLLASPGPVSSRPEGSTIPAVDPRTDRLDVSSACFGGSRSAVNAFNGVFYAALGDRLNLGPLSGIESALADIASTHPELCSVHVGERDTLVSDFFLREPRP